MKRTHLLSIPLALFVIASGLLPVVPGGADEGKKAQPSETAIGVWELPKEGDTLKLFTFEQVDPVKTTLTAKTLIEGICVHCQIALKFSALDLGKRCATCPCDLSNSECLLGKGGKLQTWGAFLKALPPGTNLRVEYDNPNTPDAGLKRLVVDRRKALLPVTGLAEMNTEALQKLGKTVGATRVECSSDSKRLLLTLKEDWSTAKEQRLEQALAKAGVKVVFPASQPGS
ncbi:MAG TPA: hypothetical protein VKU00_01790 [Chthonomonadaceae bacterium]|nr:hypothetical protein [Chthonomonadaceae bacterium]